MEPACSQVAHTSCIYDYSLIIECAVLQEWMEAQTRSPWGKFFKASVLICFTQEIFTRERGMVPVPGECVGTEIREGWWVSHCWDLGAGEETVELGLFGVKRQRQAGSLDTDPFVPPPQGSDIGEAACLGCHLCLRALEYSSWKGPQRSVSPTFTLYRWETEANQWCYSHWMAEPGPEQSV